MQPISEVVEAGSDASSTLAAPPPAPGSTVGTGTETVDGGGSCLAQAPGGTRSRLSFSSGGRLSSVPMGAVAASAAVAAAQPPAAPVSPTVRGAAAAGPDSRDVAAAGQPPQLRPHPVAAEAAAAEGEGLMSGSGGYSSAASSLVSVNGEIDREEAVAGSLLGAATGGAEPRSDSDGTEGEPNQCTGTAVSDAYSWSLRTSPPRQCIVNITR